MTQEPIQQLEDKQWIGRNPYYKAKRSKQIQQTREKTTKYFVRVEKLYK